MIRYAVQAGSYNGKWYIMKIKLEKHLIGSLQESMQMKESADLQEMQ